MNVTNNNKISLTNMLLIYVAAMYTPNIRYLLKTSTLVAKQAAWLSPIASLIVFVPLLAVLCRVMKAFEGQSLVQIMCRVFGKFIGKTLAVVLMLWLFIILSLYVKYAGETTVTTVYVGTDIRLILFISVTLTAVMLRSGLPVFSRMSTILFVVSLVQSIIIIALLFIEFDPRYVTPISTADIGPVMSSIVYPMTTFTYITFFFIFNDQIRYDKKYTSKFIITGTFLPSYTMVMLLATLGVFSASLVNKLKFPFHSAVENISVFGGSSGVESLFISIWMMLEFVVISSFAYMVVRLLREIFGLKREVPLLTAVMGFAFVFSIYLCADVFELIKFSQFVAPWFNLSLGLGIPFALFFTAKARKMLPPLPKRQRKKQAVKQPVPQP